MQIVLHPSHLFVIHIIQIFVNLVDVKLDTTDILICIFLWLMRLNIFIYLRAVCVFCSMKVWLMLFYPFFNGLIIFFF